MPVPADWMAEYIKGYDVLSSTRQSGMGPNPIQLSEILAYLQIYGTDDVDRFVQHILSMDAAYLEAFAKRQEREAEQREREAKAKVKKR